MQTLEVVKPGEYLQIPDFLSKTEVRELASKIHELEHSWGYDADRSGATLGMSWYKFMEDGMLHSYFANASRTNNFLVKNFQPLLGKIEELGKQLSNFDGKSNFPVYPRCLDLGPYWVMFGFSITNGLLEAVDAETDIGGLTICHMDYEGLVPYPEKILSDKTCAYSVIISVEAPESGGGLKVYPRRYNGASFNAPSMSKGTAGDLGFEYLMTDQVLPPVHLEYVPGTATIIDSFMPHAVEHGVYSQENPWRTVLVVHYLYLEEPEPHFQYWY